ncbi:MAG: response regulator [Spirochaetes bacterium]|nr:MAG: response regulator [Spirochaetota bacterium]
MGKRIFIVDDSAVMIMSLKQILDMEGFEVVSAKDGMEALEKIKEGLKPDLIITDVNMPRMGGLDFIKNVRPILKFVPILVLTTESDIEKRTEAKNMGATGWLVKPVGGEDLLKVINQVLPGV